MVVVVVFFLFCWWWSWRWWLVGWLFWLGLVLLLLRHKLPTTSLLHKRRTHQKEHKHFMWLKLTKEVYTTSYKKKKKCYVHYLCFYYRCFDLYMQKLNFIHIQKIRLRCQIESMKNICSFCLTQ